MTVAAYIRQARCIRRAYAAPRTLFRLALFPIAVPLILLAHIMIVVGDAKERSRRQLA